MMHMQVMLLDFEKYWTREYDRPSIKYATVLPYKTIKHHENVI